MPRNALKEDAFFGRRRFPNTKTSVNASLSSNFASPSFATAETAFASGNGIATSTMQPTAMIIDTELDENTENSNAPIVTPMLVDSEQPPADQPNIMDTYETIATWRSLPNSLTNTMKTEPETIAKTVADMLQKKLIAQEITTLQQIDTSDDWQ